MVELEVRFIHGFGIRLSEDRLDPEAVKSLVESVFGPSSYDPANPLPDFLEALLHSAEARQGAARFLTYDLEGAGGEAAYLYLPASLPWEADEEEKRLTGEEVARAIARLLAPYLRGGPAEEEVSRECGRVAAFGTY